MYFFSKKQSKKKIKKKLKKSKKQLISKNSKKKLKGIIKINKFGHGFVFINNNNNYKKIFIPKVNTKNSLNGDEVIVKIKKIENNKIIGIIKKIIKRKKNNNIIGIVKKINKNKIIVNTNEFHVDIHIIISKSNKKIKISFKDKVLIKILNWKKNLSNPIGKILKNLGKTGNPITEKNSIIEEYKINNFFSKKVIKELKKIPIKIDKKEIFKRKDMRYVKTITIDPFNAKDFDDAISIKEINDDIFEIGIHISDVTHYVKEGTYIDKEAYKRGASLYLVNDVIPMLPEKLSNNLCSLVPNEERLSFSVIFKMNKKAEILDFWIGKTIIRSDKRFNYEEVQEILKKKKGPFCKEILILYHLSKKLKLKRLINGSILMNTYDLKIFLDKKNYPKKIKLEDSKNSNFLIEEFMLLTNKKISEFVSLNKNGKPSNFTYIYRIHDKPCLKKIKEVKSFIKLLGYKINKFDKKEINNLLKISKKKKEKNIIDNLLMRMMTKAKYSTENIGHYGLSFSYYTHFTSPIRRYPDIIAHRLLEKFIMNKKSESLIRYEKKSNHCSNKEKILLEAERNYIKSIQIIYLSKFIGNIFKGIISWITDRYVYVELLFLKIDGFVKIYKNKKFFIGKKVYVKLIKVNLQKKDIELKIVKNIKNY
ncbi:ribonuclease R family protein [Candidatus Shikimatogenerans silvanidophilus]|uniref:ribonuclease R family protein n=1 Tax=Candidatus Shikimatogenerans silvanidophilus TaxID=2782547 RepID=UPI001BAC05CB|nr:VacB/RNase II family 3'-5' exoribonuclease [Candidatus Shikimatogenerans silvanidophilus]